MFGMNLDLYSRPKNSYLYTWLLSENNCHLIPLMVKASDPVAGIEHRMEEQVIELSQLTEQDEYEKEELHDLRQRLWAIRRQNCERDEAEEVQQLRKFEEQCLQEEYEEHDKLKIQARQRLRLRLRQR